RLRLPPRVGRVRGQGVVAQTGDRVEQGVAGLDHLAGEPTGLVGPWAAVVGPEPFQPLVGRRRNRLWVEFGRGDPEELVVGREGGGGGGGGGLPGYAQRVRGGVGQGDPPGAAQLKIPRRGACYHARFSLPPARPRRPPAPTPPHAPRRSGIRGLATAAQDAP